MLSRAIARRGFHTTRAQLSSPYHYPEGPFNNIPFNPKTRFFPVRYWTFMMVGFGAPFGIAGRFISCVISLLSSMREASCAKYHGGM